MTTNRQRGRRGFGSIIRRSDGRIEVRYAGRSRYAKTLHDAERLKAQMVAGVAPPPRRGTPKPAPLPQGETLAGYLGRWLDACAARGVDPATVRSAYRPAMRRVAAILGHIPVRDLQPADIQVCMTRLLEGGYALSTARTTRAILRSALVAAVDEGILSRSPVVRASAVRAPAMPSRRLPVERVRQILAAVAHTPVEGPVNLGVWYGMRISEVCGLRWQDVDSDRLHVRGQLTRTADGFKPTKNRKEREIAVIPEIDAVLKRQRVRQAADRLRLGKRFRAEGFVFNTQAGRPMSQVWVRRRMREALTAAGLPPIKFHDLRHGTASLYESVGVDITVRMAILGHVAQSTAILYTHASLDDQRGALDKMRRLIGR